MSAVRTDEGSRPQGARTAVLWVAGVGAALLAAAAALFVAVRWNEIPAEGKLAIILFVTALFLVCGEALRKTLPASGGVLFHLGAFLIPVDLAAMNLRAGLSWQELLLVEGLFCTVVFTALGHYGRSVLLRRAGALGVVATAFGIGALTSVPASLALAVAALALSIVRPRSITALCWAAVAGFTPVFVLALHAMSIAPEALVSIGLATADDTLFAVITGVIAAFVIGRVAHIDRDIGLAFIGFGAFVASVSAGWLSADPSREANLVGPAVAFVVLQTAALLLARDVFWSRPARWVAEAAETVAAFVAVFTVGFILRAPFVEAGVLGSPGMDPDRALGVFFALLAVGWSGAIIRRRAVSSDVVVDKLAAVCVALSVVAAFQALTMSPVAIAIAMIAVAAGLAFERHAITDAAAVGFAFYAPLVAHDRPVVALGCGVAAAAILAFASLFVARHRPLRAGVVVLAGVSALGLGLVFASETLTGPGSGIAFIVGCVAIAALLDTANRDVALVGRAAMLSLIGVVSMWEPSRELIVLVPLLGALAIDALRLTDRRIAYVAVVPLQVVVADIALAGGLGLTDVGVVLAVAAVVWAGLSELIRGEFRRPFEVAAMTGLFAGAVCASSDVSALGIVLLIAGALGVAAGVLRGSVALAHSGGIAVILGTWMELASTDVGAMEFYVAPVAVHLLAAGAYERIVGRANSWAAYVPAIALFGGTAFVERIAHGSGWHAIVAGAVGVAAVSWGGWRRLAGPLVTGTALLGAVTVFESLAIAATVPTWAWLAFAGTALVSAAVALERSDTSPVEAGRRVADVLATSFD